MKKITKQGRLVNIFDVDNSTAEEKNPSLDNTGYSYFPDSGEFTIHSKANGFYLNLGIYSNFQKDDGSVPTDVEDAKTYLNTVFENA